LYFTIAVNNELNVSQFENNFMVIEKLKQKPLERKASV